jgi:hypothetical protein
LKTDPEFLELNRFRSREYARKRYWNDPEFREKKKAESHKKKSDCNVYNNATSCSLQVNGDVRQKCAEEDREQLGSDSAGSIPSRRLDGVEQDLQSVADPKQLPGEIFR